MSSKPGRDLQNWRRGDRAYIRCLAVVIWDLGIHNKDELTKKVNKVLGFDWKERFEVRMTNNALAQRADKARRISTEAPEVNEALKPYWPQAKLDFANGKTSFPFDTFELVSVAAEEPNDCYHRAMPGEPRFTMLGRDPMFYELVTKWADQREYDISTGDRPLSDTPLVGDARRMARDALVWRKKNMGKWRK